MKPRDWKVGNRTVEIWEGGEIRLLIDLACHYSGAYGYSETIFKGKDLKHLKKMVDYACKEKPKRRAKTAKRPRSRK